VSYELFARPGLRSMMGFPHPVRTSLKGVAAGALTRKADGKIHYARVTAEFADGELIVTPMSGQGSHMLASMARANALAILPDGEGCKEGETVQVLLLD
ncbi:MAG TPA: molybdopterin molybdenumtransferase MoeA, partial [Acidimicrobiaceae bacterium]|nr:molybdopterin molybdenumtransferase MoeA [Acidimicrobiaceae bacterium]